MNNRNKTAVLILLAAIIGSIAPTLTLSYNGNNNKDSDRTEKYLELADKSGQKTEELINLTYINATALQVIEDAGLLNDLEGNVSLFNKGMQNLTYAYEALESEDFESAIANASEAMQLFKIVFKSIHIILEEAGISKGQLVDAQGLLEAMERALERIAKIRELLPEDASSALELLDNATVYLNLEEAGIWLLDGRVNETAHNLTQTNHLIAEARQYLKKIAEEMNSNRIRNYIKNMEKTMNKVIERLEFAERKGFNATEIVQTLGYQNTTQFRQTLQNMTQTAWEETENIKNAIENLNEIGQNLREMDKAINKQMIEQKQGNGGNDNGNGQGNNNGNGGGNGKKN